MAQPLLANALGLRRLLQALGDQAPAYIQALIDQTSDPALLAELYAALAEQFTTAAAELTAEWYSSLAPSKPFDVKADGVPDVSKFAVDVARAMKQPDPSKALASSVQRHMFDTSRFVVADNARREGVRFVRVARPSACPWCRILATAEPRYLSKATAERSHGLHGPDSGHKCHCVGVPFRADEEWVPEPYVLDWKRQYLDAVEKVGGTTDIDALAKEMRPAQYAEVKDELNARRRELYAAKRAGKPDLRKKAAGAGGFPPLSEATSLEEIGGYLKAKHGLKVDRLVNTPMAAGFSGRRNGQLYDVAPREVDVETARQFAQGVDDMLTKYPKMKLAEVAADFYPSGDPMDAAAYCSAEWSTEKGKRFSGAKQVVMTSITDPVGKAGTALAKYRGYYQAGSFYDAEYKVGTDRPAYAVAIHEMGHVFVFTFDNRAEQLAALALRRHIKTTPEAVAMWEEMKTTHSAAGLKKLYNNRLELTPQYQDIEREWLKKHLVSAYSFRQSNRSQAIINLTEALPEAFVDVELRGDKATEASKILYQAIIDAMEGK